MKKRKSNIVKYEIFSDTTWKGRPTLGAAEEEEVDESLLYCSKRRNEYIAEAKERDIKSLFGVLIVFYSQLVAYEFSETSGWCDLRKRIFTLLLISILLYTHYNKRIVYNMQRSRTGRKYTGGSHSPSAHYFATVDVWRTCAEDPKASGHTSKYIRQPRVHGVDSGPERLWGRHSSILWLYRLLTGLLSGSVHVGYI